MSNTPSFTFNIISNHFPVCILKGNGDAELNRVVPIEEFSSEGSSKAIGWVGDKHLSKLPAKISLGLLIISKKGYEEYKGDGQSFLVSPNPRQTFQRILSLCFSSRKEPKIEPSAHIHQSAQIGKDCYIGHNVVIEEGVVIGDECEILHNNCILANTQIGSNVRIGCNNTVGDRGFGYEMDAQNQYSHIEHLGKVVIEDWVEIHDNSCIARGVLVDTVIGENTKVDNLVHIAHGVQIGKNCMIIANSMIAGSVVIGDNTWVAPSASVINGGKVGANALIGMGAVVLKPVEDGTTVVGNPAKELKRK